MHTFINQLMQEYFCDYCQRRKENKEFVRFESDDELNSLGVHSNGISGRIMYRTGEQPHKSPRLFVKFLSAEDQKVWPGSPIFWFHTEIHFFTKVAPILDSFRSIRHLIPHYVHSKEDAGKVAIVFDHLEPLEFMNTDQEWRLDCAHLSLMARKIGEFHAYSFAANKLAPGQLQAVAALPVDSYTSLVTAQQAQTVQTLRRALQPLREDSEFASAVPRVEKMLANFVDSVTEAFSTNSSKADFILCHRSYSQSNVMFRYIEGAPVDLVIIDWQTMAFASLGVDLGLVLYLEASQSIRDEHWDRLLDEYRQSMSETFGDLNLPSKEKLLEELRISAATTLNMLTYKVHQAQSKSNSHADGAHFMSLISEVLKDMVRRDFI